MRQRHIPNRHHGRPAIAANKEKLWRDMRVTVCLPEQKDIVWRKRCEAGKGWTEVQLDEMLAKVSDSVEQKFPTIEFRLVELAPNDFKFIYNGRKERMSNENLNACPEVARSVQIATDVCAKLGHKLSTYQNGSTMTERGPQMNAINFCSQCGLSLPEVRGEIDKRIDAAVQERVNERMAAVAATAKHHPPAPPPVPGAGGPFAVPSEAKAKAAAIVESSS